ncbi:hypothetical protein HNO88_001527 [Novosphingobium chloroacetimidivorans]|uniref:Uncharacterized protein n=1 Tax=Novosphingobium chloroacetimidivorans TaxID=1428314 RepID=A0A7W7K9S3_9SPHN|nr:hypothetical protein [Novosphingobium chloroacetimidivorans]MBB4858208.1 hypothetical protein [Novosphingobium chloroacetimidivorans]
MKANAWDHAPRPFVTASYNRATVRFTGIHLQEPILRIGGRRSVAHPKDAFTMRNVSKLLVPALFAGVMTASMPAMAATHAAKPTKTHKVKAVKAEKKHVSKPVKAS